MNNKTSNIIFYLSFVFTTIPVILTVYESFAKGKILENIDTTVALSSITAAFILVVIVNVRLNKKYNQLLKENYRTKLQNQEIKHDNQTKTNQLEQKNLRTKDALNKRINEKDQEKASLAIRLREQVYLIAEKNKKILQSVVTINKEVRKRVIEYYYLYRNDLYDLNDKAESEYYSGLDRIISEAKRVLDTITETKCDIAIKTFNVAKNTKTRITLDEISPSDIKVRLHRANNDIYKDDIRRGKFTNNYNLSDDSILEDMVFSEQICTGDIDLRAKNYKIDYLKDWDKYFDHIIYFTISHYGPTLHTGKRELPLGVVCISNFGGKTDNEVINFIESFSNSCYFYLGARLEYRINRTRYYSIAK